MRTLWVSTSEIFAEIVVAAVTVWRELMMSEVPAPPATTSPVTNRPLADALKVSLPDVPVMLSNVPVTALAVSGQAHA